MNPMPTSMGTLTLYAGWADRLNTNGFDLMNNGCTSWRPIAVDGFDEKLHVFQTQKNWKKLTQMGWQHWCTVNISACRCERLVDLKKTFIGYPRHQVIWKIHRTKFTSLITSSHGNQIKHLPLYLKIKAVLNVSHHKKCKCTLKEECSYFYGSTQISDLCVSTALQLRIALKNPETSQVVSCQNELAQNLVI